MTITQAYLVERFTYDPSSGLFAWRTHRQSTKIGNPAGWIDVQGYRYVRLDGTLYQAHRLIWMYVTGSWPTGGYVDHIDTDPTNNRWANLRDATKRINQENRRRAARNNKAGLLGVSPNGKRWAASIISHGTKHHLGTFDTPSEAHLAYVAAKRQLHVGCTI